jgi:enoyl-CoA hydratase
LNEKKYENILVSERENENGLAVGIIQINRPKAKNALNLKTMEEIYDALKIFDEDASTGCTVITGDAGAFSAGVDIREMADAGSVEMLQRDQFFTWDLIRKIKKPVIAAVSGYALGGGCELAMLCDMIVAAKSAKFGQPEVNIGVIPGAGGTQRLTRALGKFRAMEIILTGRLVTAEEMYSAGLISKITDDDKYLDEALALAGNISSKSALAVRLAKQCVLKAEDSLLGEGIEFERKNFYLLFASEDKTEGMNAFIEKRKPNWKNK